MAKLVDLDGLKYFYGKIKAMLALKADDSAVVKSVNGVAPDTSGNVSVTVGGGGVSTDTANTWTAAQTFGDVMFGGVGKYNFEQITGSDVRPTAQYAVIFPDGPGTLIINLSELMAQTSPNNYSDILHYKFIITTQSRSIALRVLGDGGYVCAPVETSLNGLIAILEGCAFGGKNGFALITVTNMEVSGGGSIS